MSLLTQFRVPVGRTWLAAVTALLAALTLLTVKPASAAAAAAPQIINQPGLTITANSIQVTARVVGSAVTWQHLTGANGTWQGVAGAPGVAASTAPDAGGVASLTLLATADRTGQWRLVVSNTDGAQALSNIFRMPQAGEVTPRFEVQPKVRRGTPYTLTAQVGGTPTPSVTWQYRTPGSDTWSTLSNDQHAAAPDTPNPDGTVTLSLTPTPAELGYSWRAVATSELGSAYSFVVPQLPSGTDDAPRFETEPHTDFSAPSTFTIRVIVHGTPTPNLAWQYRRAGATAWATATSSATLVAPVNADAAGTAVLTVIASTQDLASQWRVVASNIYGPVASAVVSLPSQPQSFLLQPTVVSNVNRNVYAVRAIGAGVPTPQTVLWQYRAPGGAWTTAVNDAHFSYSTVNGDGTMHITARRAEMGYDWRAELYDPLRQAWTVSTTFTLPNPASRSLQVTQQPQNVVRASAGDVTLAASAWGSPVPTVIWQALSVDGSRWYDLCNPCDFTYTLHLTDVDTFHVRAMFSSKAGTAISDPAVARRAVAPSFGMDPKATHSGFKVMPTLRTVSKLDNPLVSSAVQGGDEYVHYYPTFAYRIGATGVWTTIPASDLQSAQQPRFQAGTADPNDPAAAGTARYTVYPDDPQLAKAGSETIYYTIAWWGCPTTKDGAPDRLLRDPGTGVITGCLGGPVPGSELTVLDNDAEPVRRTGRPVITQPLPGRTIVSENVANQTFGDGYVYFTVGATAQHPVEVQLWGPGDTTTASAIARGVARPDLGVTLKIQARAQLNGQTFTVKIVDTTDDSLVAQSSTTVVIVAWNFALTGTTVPPTTAILLNELGGANDPRSGSKLGGNDLRVVSTTASPLAALPSTNSVVPPARMTSFQFNPPLPWSVNYSIVGTPFGVRLTPYACEVIKTDLTSGTWLPVTGAPYRCDGPLPAYDSQRPDRLDTALKGWDNAVTFAVRNNGQTEVGIDADQDPLSARLLISSLCSTINIFHCSMTSGQVSDSYLTLGQSQNAWSDVSGQYGAHYACATPGTPGAQQVQTFVQTTSTTYATGFSKSGGFSFGVNISLSLGGGLKLGVGASFSVTSSTAYTAATSQDYTTTLNVYPGDIAYNTATIPARAYVGTVAVASQGITYLISNARYRGPDDSKVDAGGRMPAYASGTYARQMTPAEHLQLCGS